MTKLFGQARRGAALAGFVAVAFGALPAAAIEAVTESQIANALTIRPATRSLSGSPGATQPGATPTAAAPAASNEDRAFVESLRNAGNRSLSVQQRDRLATIAGTQPSIDLDIPFDLGSATITPRTRPAVDALGAALSRPNLKDGTYMIAGHTDARGADEYNVHLSERRAQAVRQYLITKYRLQASNLITAGYGKTRLKNTTDPMAGENRRVQATNLSEVRQASN